MINKIKIVLFFTTIVVAVCGCKGSPGVKVPTNEIENKGTAMGVPAPDWVKNYLGKGVSGLQAIKEYSDKYCFVGEESGVNRQFVLSWADNASAQQRIGAMMRTNIASRYEAAVQGTAVSGVLPSGDYKQEIDNTLNAVVNVSYSGAQREADWWSLRRRYDPDNKEIYTDEYTAYVLYTVPKTEMNRQTAFALETSVNKDSRLYDITIAIARDILLQGANGIAEGVGPRPPKEAVQSAADFYDPPGTPVARALEEITPPEEYTVGREAAASILASYRVLNSQPALIEYANNICAAIVINSPKPVLYNGYHVALLDSPEINAFATPGGHILVTKGLIAAAKSEDALAAVIAHEIAHIQLQHGFRAIKANRLTREIIAAGAEAVQSAARAKDEDISEWIGIFNDSGADMVTTLMQNGYSQAQEFDADIIAISLLVAAGYSPAGLIDMLKELERIQAQSPSGAGFIRTHPSPASRRINAEIAAARYQGLADNSSFRQKRFAAIK
ncbi:MAG: M48 family metalloprotease [Treponema sp.]|jgi:hypothetical protein|nr:M48 family metalloprotease [Treponema sp.]